MKREELKSMFDALRNDPQHHLGLGDIRLTVAQQDLILDAIDASLPPAEGAEENIIYHNLTQPFRQILQSVALHGYDIVFAERDCVKCATEFAALHARQMAEKMVEDMRQKLFSMRSTKEAMYKLSEADRLMQYGYHDCINEMLMWTKKLSHD